MTAEQEEIFKTLSERIQQCWNALEQKGFITNELINKQLEELAKQVQKLEKYQQQEHEYIRHHRHTR